MRILQVNHVYEEVGGAEVYFRSLSRWLEARGHEVYLFAGSRLESRDDERLRVVERPEFDAAHLIEDAELGLEFTDFVRAVRPDVIHVHNVYSFPAAFIGHLGALDIPAVQTVHDLSLVCTNGWCVLPDGSVCEGGPGKKCLESGCEANAPYDARLVLAASMRLDLARDAFDAYISPSRFVAQQCRLNGLQPVHAIPNHVDADLLPPLESGQVRSKSILYAGRLVREKGVMTLLQAMDWVARRVPGVRLTILGGGEEETSLRAMAEQSGLADTVTFLGPRERSEVLQHLQTHALMVVPSHWCENSPTSCYESLLAGLPMVASDIGGIPELVRDGVTGLIARPRDAKDLADKIVRLLENEGLREQMSANAMAEARRYTDLDEHLGSIEGVYADAIAAERRRENFERRYDLIAAVQQVNLRYSQMLDWSVFGGRPRRMLRKAAGRILRSPPFPPLGAP